MQGRIDKRRYFGKTQFIDLLLATLTFLRLEGFKKFSVRLARDLTRVIFANEKVIFFKKLCSDSSHSVLPKINFSVREGGTEDCHVLSRITCSGEAEIKRRLLDKKRCFMAQSGNEIIHYFWVTSGNEYIREINTEINIEDKEIYIFNVVTLPRYRGKRIYPFMLNYICNYFSKQGYKIAKTAVAANNIPSIKAAEKTGFRRFEEIQYRKLLWIKRYKRIMC
ncbi:GNAT family N-acetyltransferase [candidate division WOR-3 bacterium]|nr:GNAT family N-acetyltransferase [candidate division WOR-3 bacterium]